MLLSLKIVCSRHIGTYGWDFLTVEMVMASLFHSKQQVSVLGENFTNIIVKLWTTTVPSISIAISRHPKRKIFSFDREQRKTKKGSVICVHCTVARVCDLSFRQKQKESLSAAITLFHPANEEE